MGSKTNCQPSGEHLQIEVLPAVYISGTILDAISGNPVPGCKISIEQGGENHLLSLRVLKVSFAERWFMVRLL
jgi:hypothetical protein